MSDKIYYGKEALKMAIDGNRMFVVEGDEKWGKGDGLFFVFNRSSFCHSFKQGLMPHCEYIGIPPATVGFKVHKEPKFKRGDTVLFKQRDGSYSIRFVKRYDDYVQLYKVCFCSDLSDDEYSVAEKQIIPVEIREIG